MTTVELADHLPPGSDPTDEAANRHGLRSALAAVQAAPLGATLLLPPGELVLGSLDDDRRPAIVLQRMGTRLRGAGIRATRLRRSAVDTGPLVHAMVPGCAIERMTLIGNLAQPEEHLVHGAMAGGQPTFFSMTDVVLEDMMGYGMILAMARQVRGAFVGLVLHNVTVRRCGGDGIDLKLIHGDVDGPERKPLRPARGPRLFAKHVTVEDHSMLMPDRVGENGIDVRGQANLQGIEVRGIRPGLPGSRSTPGTGGAAALNLRDERPREGVARSGHHGVGAEGSTLQGYYFEQLPAADDEMRARGIRVGAAIADEVAWDVGVARTARAEQRS